MTEAEWLACEDPVAMLEHLRGRVSDRKLRLFALACGRRVCSLVPDGRDRWFAGALAVVERFVEGHGDASEFAALREREILEGSEEVILGIVDPDAWRGARAAVEWAGWLTDGWRARAERKVQARRCRCVFGNPFRPISANRSWLTSTVVALANGTYEDGAFDRLPILADALQDADCDDNVILNHCRSEGHVRGCWVVDLVLGKE
jgi:hypothetical protein